MGINDWELVTEAFLEKNYTFIGHWLGRIHGREALYAFIPILMFIKLLPPTEYFEPRNDSKPERCQLPADTVTKEGDLLVVSFGPFLFFFFLAVITLFSLPCKAPIGVLWQPTRVRIQVSLAVQNDEEKAHGDPPVHGLLNDLHVF